MSLFFLFTLLISLAFSTPAVGQTTIWSEDFDSYVDGTTTGTGSPAITSWAADGNFFGRGVFVQNNRIEAVRTDGANGREYWQIDSSDPIEITGFTNVSVTLELSSSTNLDNADYVSVSYSLDGGTSWIAFSGSPFSGNMGNPTIASVSGLAGDELLIQIRISNDRNEYYYLDNIVVEGTSTTPPSCTSPVAPLDSETGVAADGSLSWDITSGASGYLLYFGTDASATNIENGTDLGNVTSYTPSSTLSFLTDYYWKVVPYNANGNASDCSIWSFTTEDINYCTISLDPGSGTVFPISYVSFNEIDNTSSENENSPVYEDYTHISTNVAPGDSYVITIEGNTAQNYGFYTFYYSAFFDWNMDGDFDDTGEYFDIGTITYSSGVDGQQTSATVLVDNDAAIGTTTMRVVGQYYSYPSSCGALWYGQAEDYSLNVMAPCNTPDVPVLSASAQVICEGESAVLSIGSGNLNEADYWQWYSGSCGGTAIGQGTSISVSPEITTTYYARGEGFCEGSTCASITITVNEAVPDFTGTVTNASCSSVNDGAIVLDDTLEPAIEFIAADDDYIDLGSSLMSGLSEFTLEGWIQVDLSTISGSRVGSLFGQNDAIEFGFYDQNTLQCWTPDGGSVNVDASAYPADNDWHHIAVTGNGTILTIYIDGVSAGTGGIATASYGSSSFTTKIGGGIWDETGGSLNGFIKRVGFWNIALDDTEIAQLAADSQDYTGAESGLIAGYNFIEGSGTTTASMPVGNTGSFVNSPAWANVYTFSWTKTDDGSFSVSTKDLTDIYPGEYNLTVSNTNCERTKSFTVGSEDYVPLISSITAPEVICSGEIIDLATPSVTDFGFLITEEGWQLDGVTIEFPFTLSETDNGKILHYFASNDCGTGYSNQVVLNVSSTPETPPASSNSPVCHGSTIQLSTPSIAGATYNWTGPSGFTSTEQNPTLTANYYSNAGTYSVTVTVDGCTSDSGTTDVVIDLSSVGGWISYVAPLCQGDEATIVLNGNTGDVIYWERRVDSGTWETVAGASTTLTDTPPSGGDWEYRAVVQNGSCEAAFSSPITVTVHPAMTITLGSDPEVCQNTTTASFTYTETSGSPDAWLLEFDASAITAGFSSPQTSSLAVAPGAITVNVPYNAAAGTYHGVLTVFTYSPSCTSIDYPVSVTVTESAPASVLIEGNNTACAGTEETYTAIPTNGGSTPSYQWKVNGIDSGTDSESFTYTPADGDAVSCVMTSSSTCVSGSPATSNEISITVNPTPNATISTNNGPVCPGNDVVFTLVGSTNSTVFYKINEGVQSSTILTDGTATVTVLNALETQVLSLDSVIMGSCSQSLVGTIDTVFVIDTTPPVITNCPTDYLVDSQDSICGAQINYTIPSGEDDCSAVSVTLLEGLTSGDTFPTGLTTVSYEITDASGNADTCSFTVLVTDIQPPTFRFETITDTITVNNTLGECGKVVVFTAPTAYDNCGGAVVTRTSVDGSGAFFPIGITPVTYEARDISGNVINDTIYVKVIDAESPVIDTCPEIVYSTIFDTTINVVNFLSINVYDNCPGAFLTPIPETVDFSVAGTTIFESVATDVNGNTDTCSFDIVVQENSPIEKDPSVDTVCLGTTVSYYFNGDWPSKSKWSVGGPDATISDQSSQTTEITFNSAGVYTVKAKIQDTGRPTFYTDFMVVVEGNSSLVADVSISVSPSDTICAGDEVTFTAVPTNGGGAPTYQWQINGTAIPGETGSSFVSSTLTNGQEVSCVMTSSIVCVTNNPAISDTIKMEVVPLPTIVLASGTAEVCFGENSATLDYTATTGSPTKYNIDFDGDAESAGFTDVNGGGLLPGNIGISVPVTAAAGNYNAVLTVLNASNCTSIDYPITITINALPATGEIIPD